MRKVAKLTELSSYVQGLVLFPAVDIRQNVGMAGSRAVRGDRGGFGKVVQNIDFFAETETGVVTMVEQSVGANMNERFPRKKKGDDCYRKMARIEDGWTDIETKCYETAISTLCVVTGRSNRV